MTNKRNPKAIDKRLGEDVSGFSPPLINEIWIDTDKIHKELGGQEWIVNMTAHELMHRNKGTVTTLWEALITQGKSHKMIYTEAERIRRGYLDWLDEIYQKQRKECNESK